MLDDTERAGLPYKYGYRLVVAALIKYSEEAPEIISSRWKHTFDILNSDELLRYF